MPEIGQLIGTDGGTTIITRPYTPEIVVVGTVDTDTPLTRITVTSGGTVVQEISGQATIQAMAKYLMECLLGADVKIGMALKISDGFMADENFELKVVQAGTTTPKVYAYATNKQGSQLVLAGQETIQASSNITFENFTALFIPTTNFQDAQVEFEDGHTERLTAVELASLFSIENQADADGLLAGQIVIDNKSEEIASVTVFSDGGGTLQISKIMIQ